MNSISNHSQKEKPKTKLVWRGFFTRLLILFIIILVFQLSFWGYKIFQLQKNVVVKEVDRKEEQVQEQSGWAETVKSLIKKEEMPLRGAEDGRINILLLGMGGEGHQGKYLTDTIMLVSIDPQTYQAAMLSVPRDLYVEVPSSKIHTKINAVYTYSLRKGEEAEAEAFEAIKETVAEITGQEVDYYLSLDFKGFKQIIDKLGGIDVELKDDIYDSCYPGPHYSCETFQLKKGFHHLDAETALKYSRVRHNAGGDFGRIRRQQQVLASAKTKAFSLGTLANPIKVNSLINILGEHLKTDIHLSEIPAFINLAKKVNVHQTASYALDAWSTDSLLSSTHIQLGGVWAYVLLPRVRNYSQIRELADNIFDLEKIKRKTEEIEKEEAKVTVLLDSSQNYYRVKKTFSGLGYEVKVKTHQLEQVCSGEDAIVSYSSPAKLFTLDDLVDKLGVEVTYQQSSEEQDQDILICLSSQTASYFNQQNQEKKEEKYLEQSVIGKNGEVLTNEGRP